MARTWADTFPAQSAESLSLSLTHTLTHTHSLTLLHTLSLAHTHSLAQSVLPARTFREQRLGLSLTHTPSLPHSLAHSLTHSLVPPSTWREAVVCVLLIDLACPCPQSVLSARTFRATVTSGWVCLSLTHSLTLTHPLSHSHTHSHSLTHYPADSWCYSRDPFARGGHAPYTLHAKSVERTRHSYDSQGQIMALAFRRRSLKTFKALGSLKPKVLETF